MYDANDFASYSGFGCKSYFEPNYENLSIWVILQQKHIV